MSETIQSAIIGKADFEPEWEPLKIHLADELCESFQFMASYPIANGRTVYTYKHGETRRYLNIDEEGVCYRYEGGYSQISTEDALTHVYE